MKPALSLKFFHCGSTLSLKDLSIMSSAGNSLAMMSSYKLLLWETSSSVKSTFLKYFLVLKISLLVRSVCTMVGRGWSCLQAEPLRTGENRRLMEPLEELVSVPGSNYRFTFKQTKQAERLKRRPEVDRLMVNGLDGK